MGFEVISGGGVTSASGFLAASVEAGVKYPNRRDVALVFSEVPCVAVGVFTTNQVAAAPVLLGRERLADGQLQAVVFNTGIANACTGEQGLAAARAMADATAAELGIAPELVVPCSTGVIGMQLPVERVIAGVKLARVALSADGGADAAKAILTTDTFPKEAAVRLVIDGRTVSIGGMCKGAGMIEPMMATMLGLVTTDAAVEPKALRAALLEAVEVSFNRVVVDGDRSTNDTVLLLSNGKAGNTALSPAHAQWGEFVAALRAVCLELAKLIVKDGEGATKFVTVRVTGAASDKDAQLAARAVAKSPLVKTSWFGLDPNWGRVIAAVGYSGAQVVEAKARICYGGACAFDRGRTPDEAALEALRAVMREKCFEVSVDLGLGEGEDTVYTCDFSFDYVKINAEYTS